MMMEVFNQC